VVPKTSEWYGLRLAFEGAILALFAMSLTIDPTYIKYMWLAHSLALAFLNQAAPRKARLGAGKRRRMPVQRTVPFREIRGRPARAE
jgi:hypothetical protein